MFVKDAFSVVDTTALQQLVFEEFLKEASLDDISVEEAVAREIILFHNPRFYSENKQPSGVKSFGQLLNHPYLLGKIEDVVFDPDICKIRPEELLIELGCRLHILRSGKLPAKPIPSDRIVDSFGKLNQKFSFSEFQQAVGFGPVHSRDILKKLKTHGYILQFGSTSAVGKGRPPLMYSPTDWYRRYLEKLGVEVNAPTNDTESSLDS